jgi:hypothetical protein
MVFYESSNTDMIREELLSDLEGDELQGFHNKEIKSKILAMCVIRSFESSHKETPKNYV